MFIKEHYFGQRIDFMESRVAEMLKTNSGWGNGYVAIPPTNKYYAKDYEELDEDCGIYAHGGITLTCTIAVLKRDYWPLETAEFLMPHNQLEDNWWVVGFDTAHYGDTRDLWPKEAVIRETKELAKQLLEQ